MYNAIVVLLFWNSETKSILNWPSKLHGEYMYTAIVPGHPECIHGRVYTYMHTSMHYRVDMGRLVQRVLTDLRLSEDDLVNSPAD